MDLSRRGFLKISGAVLATSGIGITLRPVSAHAQ
ncbi:MAG: twin-arginine translocation signal domain-containing protein, partial [Syntrophales bacterium]